MQLFRLISTSVLIHTFYQVLVSATKTESSIIGFLYSFSFSGKILTLQFFTSSLVVFLTAYVHVLSSVSLIVPELSIKD